MSRFIIFAAALASAAPALAQEEAPEEQVGVPSSTIDVTGEVSLLSDYRFRGISRSDEDPALQASLTLSHRSGLYVGARGTSLEGLDSFRLRDPQFEDLGDVELDLYAGYGTDLGGGLELDAGALYYVFTGGRGATDYVEPYASLTYLIGPVEATAGIKYAPEQRAIGDEDMVYLFGQVDVSVPFQPWTVSASVGRQDWGPSGSYWNWSIGVEHRIRVLGALNPEIGLRYVDTDLPSQSGQDAGLVASLRLRF
jgi:uncharacterized protein (TIGR02001 family)